MAKDSKWQDEYWLLLMQIYLQKPVGLKPMYSRQMVDLSLELHIAPERLFNRMCQIANLETPRIEHIWEVYGSNPRKLTRAVSLWREMKGFNNSEAFYDGVELNEGFERDFRPLEEDERFMPVMLILILDLYFRLTPQTMVAKTPEIQELAKLMKLKATDVTEAMEVFQYCHPYLNRRGVIFHPLLIPCQQLWQRFDGDEGKQLRQMAADLRFYFE